MKKYAVVKQKHLYNGQKNTMFEGMLECHMQDLCTSLSYLEYDGCTKVHVDASMTQLEIHREGDVTTHLSFVLQKKSKGSILTEFGKIEIELFTHKYIRKENSIAIEYDILQQDEVIEGYRIIWNLKEEVE